MEQKDYKLETVSELTKGGAHARKIAKELNINHMMISRKIKELLKENVVDFIIEGKNKVFFLKKTAEARQYVFMAEDYQLIQLLKKYAVLRSIVEKIQKDKKVKLAILFGSYAKGIAKKDSDIDIYLGKMDKNTKKELSKIDSNLSIKTGKYDKKNDLIKEIEKNHVIIKGVEEYYDKNKFFEQT